MKHWASKYIGKPWAPDADGPARFSCWGLVRHVFRHERGIELPMVPIDGGDRSAAFRAIRAAAEASGWRPDRGEARPAEFDVIVLRNAINLHCGVAVVIGCRTRLLHSSHAMGVECPPWSIGIEGMTVEIWRSA